MPYRHTQRGTWIILLCLLLAALNAAIVWRSGQWPPAVALVVLIAVAIVFSSLTVAVSDNELRWHFGPGLPSYRLPLDQIESVFAHNLAKLSLARALGHAADQVPALLKPQATPAK